MKTVELDRLQVRSRWLGRAVTGLVGLLLLAVALSFVGALRSGTPMHEGMDLPSRAVTWLVFWAPAAFYLWALWAIRRALNDVAAGRYFHPAMARSLRDVGIGLGVGGAMSAVIQPNLMRLMSDAGWGRQIFASYGHFDVAYAAVGAVGLALILLSRVLHHAAEIQAELDEIL